MSGRDAVDASHRRGPAFPGLSRIRRTPGYGSRYGRGDVEAKVAGDLASQRRSNAEVSSALLEAAERIDDVARSLAHASLHAEPGCLLFVAPWYQ